MSTFFDIHNTRTRLLIGGSVVTAGAVVTHATHGVEAPGLMAVLALTLERIFGLSEHLLGHDLHKKLEERSLSADEILTNHDLSKAIADALELACQRIANQITELPTRDRSLIELIGAAAGKHLQDVLSDTKPELRPLAESEVTNVLKKWVRGTQEEKLLNTDDWEMLLCALANAANIPVGEQNVIPFYRRLVKRLRGQPIRVPVSRASIQKVSAALDPTFQAALREVLKHDYEHRGKAYAGLE